MHLIIKKLLTLENITWNEKEEKFLKTGRGIPNQYDMIRINEIIELFVFQKVSGGSTIH